MKKATIYCQVTLSKSLGLCDWGLGKSVLHHERDTSTCGTVNSYISEGCTLSLLESYSSSDNVIQTISVCKSMWSSVKQKKWTFLRSADQLLGWFKQLEYFDAQIGKNVSNNMNVAPCFRVFHAFSQLCQKATLEKKKSSYLVESSKYTLFHTPLAITVFCCRISVFLLH